MSVGWVERSETHLPSEDVHRDGFRFALPILQTVQSVGIKIASGHRRFHALVIAGIIPPLKGEGAARRAAGGVLARCRWRVWVLAKRDDEIWERGPHPAACRNRMFPISAAHKLPKSGKPDFGGGHPPPLRVGGMITDGAISHRQDIFSRWMRGSSPRMTAVIVAP